MPTPLPACPSKSFGTFWKLLMSATTLRAVQFFEKYFAWTVWKDGSLTLNCFAFPWKSSALSPVFSWESSNNISLQEYHLTAIFF
jgi:hypothetical protein